MAEQNAEYHPRIYQLDDLILDIYNAVYAKTEKYKIKFFDVSDLKMERFKLSDYSLDTIFTKTKIKYAGKYPTGMRTDPGDPATEIYQLWFKRQGDVHMTTIRIVPYANKSAVNNISDPVNVQQVVKTLMSELVVSDRTNNLLLPIVNVDIKGSDLVGYEKVAPLVDSNKYYSVQITEKFYSLTTLHNFLEEYPLGMQVIKSIIYQAVDVLYQINTAYPGFKYNQLFPLYIDCYLKKNNDIIFPELKLGDFYLSEINGIIQNDYLKKAGIPRVDTPYSDLYQLLNYMWNNYELSIKKYPELAKLFDAILPTKIRSEGMYLTQELWDSLTDAERDELRIKNIRDNNLFTTKDSLVNTSFVAPKDIHNNTAPGRVSDPDDDDIPIVKTNKTDYSAEPVDFMPAVSSGREERKPEEVEVGEVAVEDGDGEEFIESEELAPPQELIEQGKAQNKKSNSMGIEMKDKNLGAEKKSGRKERKEETTEEPTESSNEKPSRIVNILDDNNYGRSRKSKHDRGRPKIYHGKRTIGAHENAHEQLNQFFGQGANNYANNYADNSGVPSRINSIGSLLGTNPNDYSKQNNVDYSQLAQQLAQNSMPEAWSAGNLPQNYTGHPATGYPDPQQKSAPQDDALARYLMATQNQMPQQMDMSQQMPPQMPQQIPQQMQMPQQMDQSTLALLQQNPQLMQQMAPQMQYNGMPAQTGGGRRNPFFFR